MDATAKTVMLKPSETDSFTIHYDLRVGADGARSQIREYLVENADLPCSQSYVLNAYKSLFLSRLNGSEGVELYQIYKTLLHIPPKPPPPISRL